MEESEVEPRNFAELKQALMKEIRMAVKEAIEERQDRKR
jgi:hypothetical protein